MKALTLKQPWAWAVAHAGKDVENRTWRPPKSIIGQRIAIHAGKGFDSLGDLTLRHLTGSDISIPGRHDHIYGAIVAVATVQGYCIGLSGVWSCRTHCVRKAGKSDVNWCSGHCGWMLTDVMALPEPIPCKGAQGLWTVPAEIEAEINKQVNP